LFKLFGLNIESILIGCLSVRVGIVDRITQSIFIYRRRRECTRHRIHTQKAARIAVVEAREAVVEADFAVSFVSGALVAQRPGGAVAPRAQGLAEGVVVCRVQQLARAVQRAVGKAGIAEVVELIKNDRIGAAGRALGIGRLKGIPGRSGKTGHGDR